MIQKPFIPLTLALVLFVTATASLHPQSQDVEKSAQVHSEDVLPGTLIVKLRAEALKSDGTLSALQSIVDVAGPITSSPWIRPRLLDRFEPRSPRGARLGAQLISVDRLNSLRRIYRIECDSSLDPVALARRIADLPEVEYAEPQFRRSPYAVPNDPDVLNGRQYHLASISAFEGWDIEKATDSAVIAILDTGIEPDHPDLADAIWLNPGEAGELSDNGIDDDGNGYVDDWRGYDFAGATGSRPDNDPTPGNDDHGTHVAGIAAASGDNAVGGAGVAYGARLMSVKVFDDGTKPSLYGGFEGMIYAASMGADVINCSWGGTGRSRAEQEVCTFVSVDLKTHIVAAAGNDGQKLVHYPGGYEHVMSIAATRENDTKWSGSNYGYHIDVAAPGHQIWSTVFNGQYGYSDGTSMAAPVVAGMSALLRDKDSTLLPEEVTEIIRVTADNIDLSLAQYAGLVGTGRVNLGEALVSGSDARSARLVSLQIIDENGDGILDRGELITLEPTIKNVLAPSNNIDLQLTPMDPIGVEVVDGSEALGSFDRGEVRSIGNEPLSFRVPADAENDSQLRLRLDVVADGTTNHEVVDFVVFPTWRTTEYNKITSTFNSVGNVGYNGTDRSEGDGFYFETDGSLLWHAGLMIGTSASSLADVVRIGSLSEGTGDGFEMISPYRLQRVDDPSAERGEARFRDKHGTVDVDVTMNTWEFASDSNYVLITYDVLNTGDIELTDLHLGLYLDWDLQSNGQGDQASYDPERNLGFVRNKDRTNLLVGAALLSDQDPAYYAVDNLEEGVTSNFTPELKWSFLSGGVQKENTAVDRDVSMVIGGGPISLDPGERDTFAFGLLGAHDFPGLQSGVDQARIRYSDVSDVVDVRIEGTGISTTVIYGPQQSDAILRVDLDRGATARISLYSAYGQLVRSLHSGMLSAGIHDFTIASDQVASGVHYIAIDTGAKVLVRKVVLVR